MNRGPQHIQKLPSFCTPFLERAVISVNAMTNHQAAILAPPTICLSYIQWCFQFTWFLTPDNLLDLFPRFLPSQVTITSDLSYFNTQTWYLPYCHSLGLFSIHLLVPVLRRCVHAYDPSWLPTGKLALHPVRQRPAHIFPSASPFSVSAILPSYWYSGPRQIPLLQSIVPYP